MSRWSESSDDIRGLRRWAADGPASVEGESRDLLTASLAVAMVKKRRRGQRAAGQERNRQQRAGRCCRRAGSRRGRRWKGTDGTTAQAAHGARGERMSEVHQWAAWKRARRSILHRDGWRCVKCGRAARLQVDHIVPVYMGGEEYAPDNLQTLCVGCHVEKTRAERNAELSDQRRAWRAVLRSLGA